MGWMSTSCRKIRFNASRQTAIGSAGAYVDAEQRRRIKNGNRIYRELCKIHERRQKDRIKKDWREAK